MVRFTRSLVLALMWVLSVSAASGLVIAAWADDPPVPSKPRAPTAEAPRYPERPTITSPGLQQVAPVLDQVQLKLIKLENRIAALERELAKHRSVYAAHTHGLGREIGFAGTREEPRVGGVLTSWGEGVNILVVGSHAEYRRAGTTPPR